MLSLRRWDGFPDDTQDYLLASTHTNTYVFMPLIHTCTHRNIHTDAHMQEKKHSRHEKAGVAVLISDKNKHQVRWYEQK